MNYKQITERERFFIMKNIKNSSIREIARRLERSPSTISREISRNSKDNVYCVEQATKMYHKRQLHKHTFKKQKYETFTKLFMLNFDKRKCGVQTTYMLIKRQLENIRHDFNVPSQRLVYHWIKTNTWVINRNDTLRSRYQKGGKRTGGYFNKVPRKYILPLWLRPKKVDLRQEPFHYELDLVIGKKKSGCSNLMTLVERVSRKLWIVRVRSRHPREIYLKLKRLIEDNKLIVKTITVDNGFEFNELGFLGYQKKFKVYRCDPFASHQRGTNERINGDIRRWYPKGTDFNALTYLDLENLENSINEMPRHMFNLKSSNQRYAEAYDQYMFQNVKWRYLKRLEKRNLHRRVFEWTKIPGWT